MAAGLGRRAPPCPDRAKPVPPARPAPLAWPAPSARPRPASPASWAPPARPRLTHHTGRGPPGAILILTPATGPGRGSG